MSTNRLTMRPSKATFRTIAHQPLRLAGWQRTRTELRPTAQACGDTGIAGRDASKHCPAE